MVSETILDTGSTGFIGTVGKVDATAETGLSAISSDTLALGLGVTSKVTSIVVSAANIVSNAINVFTAPNRLALSPQAAWIKYSTCPTGKTLLVVHGMNSTVETAFPAGQTIQAIMQYGGYASVVGFDYDWTQSIGTSGAQLLAFLNTLTQCPGISLDIEAHSEGVPVTMSALPYVSSAQSIRNFIALGGPIMGTPMAMSSDTQYLQAFLAAEPSLNLASSLANLTLSSLVSAPFVSDLQVSTPGDGSNLDKIRQALAPYAARDTPKIFVVGGNTPGGSLAYTALILGDLGVSNSDGFIPVASALAVQPVASMAIPNIPVLRVHPFPPFGVNHLDLTTDPHAVIPNIGVQALNGFPTPSIAIAAVPSSAVCNGGIICAGYPGTSYAISGSGFGTSTATEYELADTGALALSGTLTPSSGAVPQNGWQDVTTCASLPKTVVRFAEIGTVAGVGAPSNAVTEEVSSGTCTTPTLTISVSPTAAIVAPGGSQRFTATTSDGSSVLWSVQEGPSGGSVDSTGLYTAPVTTGTYHVIATSVSYPTISAFVPVSVTTGSVPVAGSAMLKMNPQRTNRATVAGPSNLPIFTSVVTGVIGALRRVGADGTLITTSTGTCAPAGSCQVVTAYTASGSTKWTRSLVLQDGQGFSDVAIAPSGVVYVTSYYGANVYALDGATGSVLWTTSTNSTGTNESGDLMIDPSGTIYFETSTSVVGPTNQLTAISPAGAIKWNQVISTEDNKYAVLSNDNQLVYITGSQGSPYNYPQINALSTIDGSTQYFNTCYMTTVDVVDGMTVFGELTNSHLAAATGQLSSCTDLQPNSSGPAFDNFEALTPSGVLIASTNYVLSGFFESGSPIWTGTQQMGGGFSDSNGTLFEIVFTPGTSSSTVEALNGNTGVLSWQYTFPAAVFSGATVAPAPNTIQIGPDGSLYVLAGQTIYRGKP